MHQRSDHYLEPDRDDGLLEPFAPDASPNRDIIERERLEGLAGHLAAVVGSSASAIISKGLDGAILSWNPGAEQLYGYSEAEAVGKPISMLRPDHEHDEVGHLLARVVAGERVGQIETERRRKDGSLVAVALAISAARDKSGRVGGVPRSRAQTSVDGL
jgi:PAS domain S-box-containing protein